MYFVSKKLKKKHNITDERAALYEAAETWVDALNGRHYLGVFNSHMQSSVFLAKYMKCFIYRLLTSQCNLY